MKKREVYRIDFVKKGKADYRYVENVTCESLARFEAVNGLKVTKKQKCYPINMEKNQHNFELISNVCANEMYDMNDGRVPYDAGRYAELQQRKEDAERFFCMYGMFNSGIAWFIWDDYKKAKDMIAGAVNHRMDACEKARIPYVE